MELEDKTEVVESAVEFAPFFEAQEDLVLGEILAERVRQHQKWGQQDHPNGTGGAAARRSESFAKLRTDKAFLEGHGTWLLILHEEVLEAFACYDALKLRGELVQVAAVATAWIQAIDRAEAKNDTEHLQAIKNEVAASV